MPTLMSAYSTNGWSSSAQFKCRLELREFARIVVGQGQRVEEHGFRQLAGNSPMSRQSATLVRSNASARGASQWRNATTPAATCTRARSSPGYGAGRHERQRLVQPRARLTQRAPDIADLCQRRDQAQPRRPVCIEQPCERRAQVVAVRLQPVESDALLGTPDRRIRPFGEFQHEAACRARIRASSPDAESCSNPNSRIVSSIPKRGGLVPSSQRSRLWSASNSIPAPTSIPRPSPLATASAASGQRPPTKTDNRRKSTRSSSVSRSWLQRSRRAWSGGGRGASTGALRVQVRQSALPTATPAGGSGGEMTASGLRRARSPAAVPSRRAQTRSTAAALACGEGECRIRQPWARAAKSLVCRCGVPHLGKRR